MCADRAVLERNQEENPRAPIGARNEASRQLDQAQELREKFVSYFENHVLDRMATNNLRSDDRNALINELHTYYLDRKQLHRVTDLDRLNELIQKVEGLGKLADMMEGWKRGDNPAFLEYQEYLRKKNLDDNKKNKEAWLLSAYSVTDEEIKRYRLNERSIIAAEGDAFWSGQTLGNSNVGNLVATIAQGRARSSSSRWCARYVKRALQAAGRRLGVDLSDIVAPLARQVPDRLRNSPGFQSLYTEVQIPESAYSSREAMIRFLSTMPRGTAVYYENPRKPRGAGHAQIITGPGRAVSDFEHGLFIYASAPRPGSVSVFVPRDAIPQRPEQAML